jgi:hypothetical protein
MSISQVGLQPVFATALISHEGASARELSFEKGDLIQVQKDLGDGVVFGSNVSKGSTTGTVGLRHVELNLQTEDLEATQRAVEELIVLRREYEEIRRQRETMQAEVGLLYETKEEMEKMVNPIRYSLRSLNDLFLHLIQTDIESIEVSELVREAQNDWTSIVGEINRLQVSIDDPELDPFRRLVLDRCDGLKKRVAALEGPATETLSISKMLHVDLENLANAFLGRPLLARPPRHTSEHSRTHSQGSLASSSSSITPAPASIKGHIASFSSTSALSSPALSRAALLSQKPVLGGSLSNLPEYYPSEPNQPVGTDFFASSDALSHSPTTGFSPPKASPIPKHLDRNPLFADPRARGSSPALVTGHSSASPSPSTTHASPPSTISPGIPGANKFVFGTKPSSLKFELPETATKKDGTQ